MSQVNKIFELLELQNEIGKDLLDSWKKAEKIKDKAKSTSKKEAILAQVSDFEKKNALLLEMVEKELNRKSKVVNFQLHQIYRILKETTKG